MAKKDLVSPQKGQGMPVKKRKRHKGILGQRASRSILKKYRAIPEAREQSSTAVIILRKIKEEEISFNVCNFSDYLPK